MCSRPIYYLVTSLGDDCKEEDIMAISFDKKVLENMSYNNFSNPNLIIRENLKIFSVWLGYDSKNQCDEYNIMYNKNIKIDYQQSNLYAFNRRKRFKDETYNHYHAIYENGIIDLYPFYDKVSEISLLKDNISVNEIKFDTYYEEGIMNA
jgi:hypothetical protein